MSSVFSAFSSDVVRRLSELDTGDRGVVSSVDTHNTHRTERLLALGITPGARVTLLQGFPGVVFECDQTEIAVERDVAKAIWVKVDHGDSVRREAS